MAVVLSQINHLSLLFLATGLLLVIKLLLSLGLIHELLHKWIALLLHHHLHLSLHLLHHVHHVGLRQLPTVPIHTHSRHLGGSHLLSGHRGVVHHLHRQHWILLHHFLHL